MNRTNSIQNLLILEGMHGTGKSMAATALSGSDHHATLHFGKPLHADPWREYMRPIMLLEGWTVVCDRFHLGEYVWPAIFGRFNMFDSVQRSLLPEFQLFEAAVRDAADEHVEIWYLMGPTAGLSEQVRNSCRDKGLSDDQMLHALELYEQALERTSFEVKRLTWDDLPKEIDRWNMLR